jgi:hypothetical protein
MSIRRGDQGEINLDKAEESLKDYRFLKTPIRNEIDEFFTLLPEPYSSFARFRYQHSETMEEVADKLGYSTRTCYNFRLKVLKWWVLFLTGKKCS